MFLISVPEGNKEVAATAFIVDFCPFCGTELQDLLRKKVTEQAKAEPISNDYLEYRRNFVSERVVGVEPLGREEFEQYHKEWKENILVLPYANENQLPSLLERQKELNELLCMRQSLDAVRNQILNNMLESKNDSIPPA